MNIITGYTGEPHITSEQDRAGNQGSYGTGSYILDVGNKLSAEIVSANEIRIRDGVLSHQGCLGIIKSAAYDSVEISNGTQGMQRRDLIVCRYERDANTNVESLSIVVIEGTPAASSPADPSYNSGDIQSGASPVDMPLYRVDINGVNVSDVTRIANYVRTQAEIDTLLGTAALNTSAKTLTGAINEHESDISGLNSNLSYASIRGADVLTLSSAFASATISDFVIKRVGRIAHVTGIIGGLSIQAERNVIGTLGNGWRPHVFDVFTIGTIGPGGNVGNIVRVEINTNGVLTVVSNVAIASSLRFGCSYVLAV